MIAWIHTVTASWVDVKLQMKRLLIYGYIGLSVLTTVSFINYYLISSQYGLHRSDEPTAILGAFSNSRRERDVMSLDIPLENIEDTQNDAPVHVDVPDDTVADSNSETAITEPVKNIYYVKVHKAGSTTLQSIMFRFAMKHDLRVAVYNRKWGMPYPDYARAEYLYENTSHPQFQRYNMICDHAVYDRDVVAPYMHDVYESVAILREPYSHLLSAFSFWGIARPLGLQRAKDPVREFLTKNPNQYRDKTPHFNRTKNMQAFHFGHLDYHDNSEESSQKLISHVDKHFKLVMIRERFEESLVLLRRLFRWDFEDIMYLEQFVNTKPRSKQRSESDDVLLRAKHREFAPVDYRLYDHFTSKLDKMLGDNSDDLHAEVAHLKETNRKIAEFCENVCALFPLSAINNLTVADILPRLKENITLAASKWHSNITLSYEKCAYMKFWTFQYHNAFRVKQLPASCPQSAHIGPPVDQPIFPDHDLVKQGYCEKDQYVLFKFPLDVFKEIVLDVPLHPVTNKKIAKAPKCAKRTV